ncbi:MAG TPA: NAD-dependent epimerase/dehydratase [Parachlamydiales bacterium]|nr:NAD-dependent epimerase/dehydratase [Parachlamydiales bacterium]
MKYLVLGSSGQLGFSLVKHIKKIKEEVIPFDLVNNQEEDLRIPNNKLLLERMEEADFVFFLAFDVGGSRYLKTYQNTLEFVSNNIRIIENTFSFLQKTKKPFLFASSQMSNMGYSPYGQLKALGELYTKILGGLIVKFWNVYGIEKDLEKSHVITDFLLKARNNKNIDMMTDGNEMRQFLYADDCSECIIKLAKEYNNISREKELHITNFKWNYIKEVAEVIAKLYPGTNISPGPSADEVQKDKRNEPDPYILRFWKPKTELADGIKRIKEEMEIESIL